METILFFFPVNEVYIYIYFRNREISRLLLEFSLRSTKWTTNRTNSNLLSIFHFISSTILSL